MYEISNQQLVVSIASKGAELKSIVHQENGLEYLWDANPAYWSKTSPVLFPIVGSLNNNTYTYKGEAYQLGRHGFARDTAFAVTQQTESSITFSLYSNEDTLKVYPFHFAFHVTYALHNNSLSCTYHIQNTGDETMYCSVGAHPAFKLPLTSNTQFQDWYLHFQETENAGIYPLASNGLLETQATPYLQNAQTLPLQKELFYKDALVFKELKSTSIAIKSNKTTHGITMHFKGFPYYGIWSFKDADFVCLEPWYGIADSINASGDITNKEGIDTIEPNASFEKTWVIDLY